MELWIWIPLSTRNELYWDDILLLLLLYNFSFNYSFSSYNNIRVSRFRKIERDHCLNKREVLMRINELYTKYYYYCTIFLSIIHFSVIIIRVSLLLISKNRAWSLSEQQEVNENNRLSYNNNGWNYGFGSLCLLETNYIRNIIIIIVVQFFFQLFTFQL